MTAELAKEDAGAKADANGTDPHEVNRDAEAMPNLNGTASHENRQSQDPRDELIAALIRRIEALEKKLEGSKVVPEEEPEEQNADREEAKEDGDEANEDGEEDKADGENTENPTGESVKSKTAFGSLAGFRLTLFQPMCKIYPVLLDETTGLRPYAITAFYDVPPSAVNNLAAWQEGTEKPEYLPARVSINSKRIIELLKTITDTTFSDAPVIMMPPFKLFATYWADIEAKMQELQDEFAERYGYAWNAEPPKDETPKEGPLSEEEAERNAQKEDDRKDAEHLQCLVDFMKEYLSGIPELRKRIKDKEIDSLPFDDLWQLFNPGDIILSRQGPGKGDQQAYQVFSVTKGRFNVKDETSSRDKPERNDLHLQCFSLDYDGTKFDTREEMLYIKPFIGKKKITDLDYYPKAFAADKELKDLEKRARLFVDNRYGHGRCEGLTSRFEIEHIDNEEVFVDFKSGYEEIPFNWKEELSGKLGVMNLPECGTEETWESGCSLKSCGSCGQPMYLDEQVDVKRAEKARDGMARMVLDRDISTLKATPDLLLLLPSDLLVYTLRTKKWHFVSVRDFERIFVTPEKIKEGWKNLVIEPENKRLLKAMVSDHAMTMELGKKASLARSGSSIDIIRGKGRGRIVFLYGPPGVGKTSTAETIAAFTSPPRPLYPITCGDLGSNPQTIQESLEGHFKLAHRWNCVLLLDEADVYLAERHHNDLDRNGIVSVFLRTLEYYSGLLFLTSNRVGSIDSAFKSRIHVALRYSKINLDGTKEIWTNILNGIDKDNADERVRVKIDYDRDDLLEWARKHYIDMEESGVPTWNGRQIRNAFQSAIALASHDRLERLRKKGMSEERAAKSKNPALRNIQLLEEHFDDVSKIVHKFENYLIDIGRGEDKATKEGLLAPEPDQASQQAYGRRPTTKGQQKKKSIQANKAKQPPPPAAAANRVRRPPQQATPANNNAGTKRQVTKTERVTTTTVDEEGPDDGDNNEDDVDRVRRAAAVARNGDEEDDDVDDDDDGEDEDEDGGNVVNGGGGQHCDEDEDDEFDDDEEEEEGGEDGGEGDEHDD
ncbi:hypothetical protein QBC47DRAFT_134106 [Echria macrotheca]|uniref:AAA+ ATPase domain-containing protein n=1 Tax=Echria macrotheca TaxID=438768 RepID=A0AAJ0FEI9_9PEZI|nr:hypothetical protein QBC47DRAFT_134106 [Echria macrotheca]